MENLVIEKIKTVYDPEIPVDVYELGLIYQIEVSPDQKEVQILMTLTSPNCPSAEEIPVEIEQKVKTIEGVETVRVKLTFEPPWDKDMMSEEAQLELGFL
ncbi:MAG: iron-sulfur cluster assembly protein [Bacteroidetes bacterium]|jgi:FeS assembly SUF system protein|nr:iron-sulfur cluster assembly protein [Bacteroidota bacterium]